MWSLSWQRWQCLLWNSKGLSTRTLFYCVHFTKNSAPSKRKKEEEAISQSCIDRAETHHVSERTATWAGLRQHGTFQRHSLICQCTGYHFKIDLQIDLLIWKQCQTRHRDICLRTPPPTLPTPPASNLKSPDWLIMILCSYSDYPKLIKTYLRLVPSPKTARIPDGAADLFTFLQLYAVWFNCWL